MMDGLKKLSLKLLLLGVIIISLNYIYKYTFFENDLQTHAPLINLVRKVVDQKAEIVYVGESSNITTKPDDIDKRSISDFILEYYPNLKVGAITKEASHAGIYYELLNNIPTESEVKTVVVTLNLRSFDANWIYSNLETPLQKSIVLLKDNPPLVNRFLLTFKQYEIKTEQEREKQFKDRWTYDTLKFPHTFPYKNVIAWDKAMAEGGIRNSDNSINYPLTELACHYVKTYAFQIDTLTNPRIKDFDKIVALAKKRNWNLIFNLMAENVARANELVGEELVYLIRQNRDLLVNRYSKNNVIVVDNLECVGDMEYIDRNWTTEHYAEKGRKIIAKNVAEKLKVFYPKQFVNVDYKNNSQSTFFNDCEGNITWGQMQTITSEKTYAGEKSSKTGLEQDYSITFEYPIENLPSNLKQVTIEMALYQSNLNHDAKLLLDISGKEIAYQLQGALLKDLSKTEEKWTKVKFNFTLPKDFSKGDLVKIFVFNPTNTVIYIDDVNIKFTE